MPTYTRHTVSHAFGILNANPATYIGTRRILTTRIHHLSRTLSSPRTVLLSTITTTALAWFIIRPRTATAPVTLETRLIVAIANFIRRNTSVYKHLTNSQPPSELHSERYRLRRIRLRRIHLRRIRLRCIRLTPNQIRRKLPHLRPIQKKKKPPHNLPEFLFPTTLQALTDRRPHRPRPNKKDTQHTCLYAYCGKTFTRAYDLDRHMKIHFPGSVIKLDCPKAAEGSFCGRMGENGFTRRDHMQEHLRKVHVMDIPKSARGTRHRDV